MSSGRNVSIPKTHLMSAPLVSYLKNVELTLFSLNTRLKKTLVTSFIPLGTRLAVQIITEENVEVTTSLERKANMTAYARSMQGTVRVNGVVLRTENYTMHPCLKWLLNMLLVSALTVKVVRNMKRYTREVRIEILNPLTRQNAKQSAT